MSTVASNNAVLDGHCVVVLGLEHAQTIAQRGWSRSDVRHFLWMHSGNRFEALSRGHRYGRVYNRNLPKWVKREPDSRVPIVPSPDNIHLFVVGGGRGASPPSSPAGPHEHAGAARHRRGGAGGGVGLRRRVCAV
jgi:hypothetical protein